VFVSAGELSSLTLVMHRPGATQVSVDFPDGGRELLPAGSQLVSAGTSASSTNYKVVFTVGQPSQAQGAFDSPGYRLRGGLGPINGSTP
jgi:hypothetical protein